ncbi:hypothetical protein BMETH_3137_0 [methanotrophic bacterial endosymbiont of Bathymodiolus sp.]|nr:hypothetical protein BMETH_3137_0 [methanotrophic bacterial endosymbiont of Bathymodiolus sp.]
MRRLIFPRFFFCLCYATNLITDILQIRVCYFSVVIFV